MTPKTFTCPQCGRPVQVSDANLKYEPSGRVAYCSTCQEWTIHLIRVVKDISRNRPKHLSKKERLRLRRGRKSE